MRKVLLKFILATCYSLLAVFFLPESGQTKEVLYYMCDINGTPVEMTNEKGNVVWRGSALPFGEDFGGSGSRDTEIGYCGKPYNPNIELYDLGARYYDPTTGRFTSVDPVMGDVSDPQRLNSYAYGLNSPYKYVDPDGKEVLTLSIWAAIAVGTIVAYELTPGVYQGQVATIRSGIKKVLEFFGPEAASTSPQPQREPPVGGDKGKKVVNKKEAPGTKDVQQMIEKDDPIVGSLKDGKVNKVDFASQGGHGNLNMGAGENGFTVGIKNGNIEIIGRGRNLTASEIKAIGKYFGIME